MDLLSDHLCVFKETHFIPTPPPSRRAGGLRNTGHQCGMIWGATLAIGTESFRRHPDRDHAIAVALTASENILESFAVTAGNVNCREITGCNLNSVLGMASFGAKTILTGMEKSLRSNLAERWAPEAVRAAEQGLVWKPDYIQPPVCCATEVARKMRAREEEMVTVAGLSGSIGLSGNACGALGAAIWLKTLAWCRAHPGKTPPYFFNRDINRIMKAFSAATGGEILCHRICNQHFRSIDEHTEFVENGGCSMLIDVFSQVWIEIILVFHAWLFCSTNATGTLTSLYSLKSIYWK